MRNVCFTVFVNPELFYEFWLANDLPQGISYLVFQMEKCPESGRIHIQGYAETKNGKTLSGWKKALKNESLHVEGRKGSAEQAAAYCKKDESRERDPVEKGEISKQGARSDLAEAAQAIAAGASMLEIATLFPTQMIRYHGGLRAYKNALNAPKLRQRMHTFWISGPSGIGKTLWAKKMYPNAYWMMDHDKAWADGYDGQEAVVLDEFMGLVPRNLILNIMDDTKVQLPVKGGFASLQCRVLVITSNKRYQDCYRGTDALVDAAWVRRIEDPRICTIIDENDPALAQAIADKVAEQDEEVPMTPPTPEFQ